MNERGRGYLRFSGVIAFTLMAAMGVYAATSNATDEAAVRKQLSGYADARRTGDGHAQSRFFTDDADEWGLARQARKGRAQLAQGLNLPREQAQQFRLEVTNVSFLRLDIALVGPATDPAGHAFYLLVKENGQWLIRASRITRFPLQIQ
jgi:ketosteroid isomerase-like protein